MSEHKSVEWRQRHPPTHTHLYALGVQKPAVVLSCQQHLRQQGSARVTKMLGNPAGTVTHIRDNDKKMLGEDFEEKQVYNGTENDPQPHTHPSRWVTRWIIDVLSRHLWPLCGKRAAWVWKRALGWEAGLSWRRRSSDWCRTRMTFGWPRRWLSKSKG